jgi:hypothetical protein
MLQSSKAANVYFRTSNAFLYRPQFNRQLALVVSFFFTFAVETAHLFRKLQRGLDGWLQETLFFHLCRTSRDEVSPRSVIV